jgi:hypothetical protein
MKSLTYIILVASISLVFSSCFTAPATRMSGPYGLGADTDYIVAQPHLQPILVSAQDPLDSWTIDISYDTGSRVIESYGDQMSAEEMNRAETNHILNFRAITLRRDFSWNWNFSVAIRSVSTNQMIFEGVPQTLHPELEIASYSEAYRKTVFWTSFTMMMPQIPDDQFPIEIVVSHDNLPEQRFFTVFKVADGFGDYSFSSLPVPELENMADLQGLTIERYLEKYRIPYSLYLSVNANGQIVHTAYYERTISSNSVYVVFVDNIFSLITSDREQGMDIGY